MFAGILCGDILSSLEWNRTRGSYIELEECIWRVCGIEYGT